MRCSLLSRRRVAFKLHFLAKATLQLSLINDQAFQERKDPFKAPIEKLIPDHNSTLPWPDADLGPGISSFIVSQANLHVLLFSSHIFVGESIQCVPEMRM